MSLITLIKGGFVQECFMLTVSCLKYVQRRDKKEINVGWLVLVVRVPTLTWHLYIANRMLFSSVSVIAMYLYRHWPDTCISLIVCCSHCHVLVWDAHNRIYLFFSVRLLSVLRGHSVLFIPATTTNDLRLRRISIPDLILYIIFLS